MSNNCLNFYYQLETAKRWFYTKLNLLIVLIDIFFAGNHIVQENKNSDLNNVK